MRGSATGKLVDWASGEEMSKMTDQFGAADYSTFGALLVLRYGPSLRVWFVFPKSVKNQSKNG